MTRYLLIGLVMAGSMALFTPKAKAAGNTNCMVLYEAFSWTAEEAAFYQVNCAAGIIGEPPDSSDALWCPPLKGMQFSFKGKLFVTESMMYWRCQSTLPDLSTYGTCEYMFDSDVGGCVVNNSASSLKCTSSGNWDWQCEAWTIRSDIFGLIESLMNAAESQPEPECHASYSNVCLSPWSIDYDCAGRSLGNSDGPDFVQGPVFVVGFDEYGLDGDGDGVGCEPLGGDEDEDD